MYLMYYGVVQFRRRLRARREGLHRRRARRHRLAARRGDRRAPDRPDRDHVVGLFLDRLQGRRRLLDPRHHADLPAAGPARPARTSRRCEMADERRCSRAPISPRALARRRRHRADRLRLVPAADRLQDRPEHPQRARARDALAAAVRPRRDHRGLPLSASLS